MPPLENGHMIRRRDFLAGAAASGAFAAARWDGAAAAADEADWNAGSVQHLLPTVNSDRMLLKVSLHEALNETPVLHVDSRAVVGARTDSDGFFWQFDAIGLEPARAYSLGLADARGHPLCDPWPLATLP